MHRFFFIALALLLAATGPAAAQGSKAIGQYGSVFLSANVRESEWPRVMTSAGWGTTVTVRWEYTGAYASHITITKTGDIVTSSPGKDIHRPAGEAVEYPVEFLVSWRVGDRWLRKNGKNPASKRRGNLAMDAGLCKGDEDARRMWCRAYIDVFVPAGRTLQVRVRPFWADGAKGPDFKCSVTASDWYVIKARRGEPDDVRRLSAGPFGRASC